MVVILLSLSVEKHNLFYNGNYRKYEAPLLEKSRMSCGFRCLHPNYN